MIWGCLLIRCIFFVVSSCSDFAWVSSCWVTEKEEEVVVASLIRISAVTLPYEFNTRRLWWVYVALAWRSSFLMLAMVSQVSLAILIGFTFAWGFHSCCILMNRWRHKSKRSCAAMALSGRDHSTMLSSFVSTNASNKGFRLLMMYRFNSSYPSKWFLDICKRERGIKRSPIHRPCYG